MISVLLDAWLRVDRQPIESLLATFGLDRSMRSGGVIMVFIWRRAASGAWRYIVIICGDWGAFWGAEGMPLCSMTLVNNLNVVPKI